MEGIVEASWNAFDATTVLVEESELMAQLLGGAYPFSVEQLDHDHLNLAMPSAAYWSDRADDSAYSTYQDMFSSCTNDMSIGGTWPSGHQTYYYECEPNVDILTTSAAEQEGTIAPSISFGCLSGETSSDDLAAGCGSNQKQVAMPDQKPQMKRKFSVDDEFDKTNIGDAGQKLKKAKMSSQVKNPKPKKTKKSIRNGDEEESDVVEVNVQGSISCNTEEESNASEEEAVGAALNLDGKTRASRGSATDPQSLYARKRRERINERLRILQNLVPNGTKVDISTMLEEAVQYVKFLQLQIKLLSSDKLWMYAPLAYNGMDIGLDMKISLPNQ